ncbi:chemotaxis protein CheW [Myxacorys almedinensis]|uniref:Chemotaxis protein CheW n=1 Tax=Myxacorys almedinensis A TaxID=2690445 RepID=A0A8J8CPM4_9CYAN|nr:chemotaxis protein CheW [Myxacorys almedinensis]NDJ19682.1 chemotaxis protein CheW [Myxacorys almedinensis A]
MVEPSNTTQFPLPYASSIASLEFLLAEPAPIELTQKFLRFRLEPDHIVLVPVEDVMAVLTISIHEVLPIPHMNAAVLGVFSWRGEALWLVDLSNQVGFQSLIGATKRLSGLTIIVVQSESQSLGLAVPEVQDIESHSLDQLHSPSNELFAPQLFPFVKGYFLHDRTFVLNTSAIVQDPHLQRHTFKQS